MKTKITLLSVVALFGAVIAGVDLTTPRDATSRLAALSRLIQKFGVADTFAKINGFGSGNHFDDGEHIMRNEFNAIKSADPTSYIVCVKNSTVAVHQAQPSLIGKSVGSTPLGSMHANIVKQLGIHRGNIVAVPFGVGLSKTIDATTGKPISEGRRIYAAHSQYLLGRKNNTGEKFYCAVID